jgi:hypothetical protein
LNTRESLIAIFLHIRDIPYEISTDPGFHNPATAPGLLLQRGRGSCAPKHYLLSDMYRKMNINVVFATFPFLWNDPGILYPPGLRLLAARLPVAYHLACRVQIGCRWVLVDATWDPPLQHAGFPVNGHWDGFSEMRCAVKPLRAAVRTAYCRTLDNEPLRDDGGSEFCPVDGEKDHWEAEDGARYYRDKTSVRTPEEVEATARFYREFNEWLDRVRASARD